VTQLPADERVASVIVEDTAKRDVSMDSLRFLSFLAVVTLHVTTSPTRDITAFSIVDHLTRFAVPVYFMMSGYFFERPGCTDPSRIAARAQRLLVMFAFWEVVYNFINLFVFRTADYPPGSVKLVYYIFYYSSGPAYHLWFLPHLCLSVVIFTLLRRFGFGWLLALAAVAFLGGLAVGPWSVLAGPDAAPISVGTRNGLVFGFPFFTLGAFIRYSRFSLPPRVLALALVFGFALQLLEAYAISRLGTGRYFAPQDFLLGTAFFSVAVFMIFRQMNISHPILARLGRISPGIYCIHILFFSAFVTPGSIFFIDDSYIATANYPMALFLIALTAGCAIAATLFLSKFRIFRPVVQ
jgi:surface polysaccharide O-acyltransferase-like enzyme